MVHTLSLRPDSATYLDTVFKQINIQKGKKQNKKNFKKFMKAYDDQENS